ncbi:MAG: tetratricopeptide repeat protein [Ginsengibacter sp.]
MRKFIGSVLCLFILLSAIPGFSQKMTWTTKSEEARQVAMNGSHHFMNAEFAQAYNDFSDAVKLDPDFTVALVFMANLTRGESRKMYAKEALESAGNKTDGEKLFASLVDEKNKRAERADIVAKLHTMFPDGAMIANFYVQTRATPQDQLIAGEEYIKKFPDEPSGYNTMGYLNLQVKKDTAAAKPYFEKYITMYPDGCNPYDSMGEFYLDTGDTANAEKYYNMALEKYPFNISSIEALQKIEMGKKK